MRREQKRGAARLGWVWNYSGAIQSALLIFVVGGTFLSQSTFEFVFALCAAIVPLAILAEQEGTGELLQEEGAGKRPLDPLRPAVQEE